MISPSQQMNIQSGFPNSSQNPQMEINSNQLKNNLREHVIKNENNNSDIQFEREVSYNAISKNTQDMLKNYEKEQFKECTFHPKIDEKSKQLEINPERFKTLTTPKTAFYEKWESLKKKKEDQETLINCTFRPKINETDNIKFNSESVKERLYNNAKNKENEEEIEYIKNRELKGCTFHPEISTAPKIPLPPIHERFDDVQKKKKEHIEQLHKEYEENNPNFKFLPTISEESNELASKKIIERNLSKNVAERLYSDASERIEHRYKKNEEQNCAASEMYSFNPNVSQTKSFSQINHTTPNYDFFERLEFYENKKRDIMQVNVLKYENNSKYTFKPTIDMKSAIIADSSLERTDLNNIERLMRKDGKYFEKTMNKMNDEFNAVYTYCPEITEKSKQIVLKAKQNEEDIEKLMKEKFERKRQINAQRALSECRFRPYINKNIEAISKYHEGSDFLLELKTKEEKKKILKDYTNKQNEIRVQETCTFKPEINDKINSQMDKVVLIRGLDKHLENIDRKKKIENDKKEREEKVFGLKGRNNSKGPQSKYLTIPKPFQLSTSTIAVDVKKEKIENILKQELQECTFKQKTIESTKKEKIRSLLISLKNERKENI